MLHGRTTGAGAAGPAAGHEFLQFFRVQLRSARAGSAVLIRDHVGVGPLDTKPGDQVSAFYGGDLCYMLRRMGKYHSLIGDAYVHGVMGGELMSKVGVTAKEIEFSLR